MLFVRSFEDSVKRHFRRESLEPTGEGFPLLPYATRELGQQEPLNCRRRVRGPEHFRRVMFSANRNFVFAYAFLVILPLVGLAGILKGGRGLQAPASIDGLWTLQLDSGQLDSLPCGKVLAAIPDQAILISQSGNSFVLSFPGAPKITASGALDGTTLRVSLNDMGASKKSGCAEGQAFTMLATVDRRADS